MLHTTFIAAILIVRKMMKNCHRKLWQHGGSLLGKATNLELGRFTFAARLHKAYFPQRDSFNELNKVHGPTFTVKGFEKRFRMLRVIYKPVKSAIVSRDLFFREGDECLVKSRDLLFKKWS